ncbi:hypothetical protein AWB64_02540 [Caballeronia sordidicola]|uniref:Tail fiber protein n=1 Tax=Caballeronia sordidicola TaxID=196367 RepID=A0A158GC97_CABSO|nr:hypothetical protein [Caballeronia sordidicola]SAL29642.1 hypothetical protein AWB64_02540 [Caballeronia sordidicola]
MSVPDPSNSKAPPSLLSSKGKSDQANGARILASLEGRVEGSSERPAIGKAAYAALGSLLLGIAAWGGWHYFSESRPESAVHAQLATSANNFKAATPPPVTNASESITAKNVPASAVEDKSQAAAIVATDDDAEPGTTGRIASALESGAASASFMSSGTRSAKSVIATEASRKKDEATAKTCTAHIDAKAENKSIRRDVRESRGRSASKHEALAAQNRSRSGAPAAAKQDDQDVDLLAALVSRTKPYTPPSAGKAALTGTPASMKADPGIATRLKQCGKENFFSDEICRWRVCNGYWGKDPACPAASASNGGQK